MNPLQIQLISDSRLLILVIRILGLAALSGGIVIGVSMAYRGYSRSEIPEGVSVLIGVGAVAIWLNTTASLGRTISGETGVFSLQSAFFTLSAFFVAGIAADMGRRFGDRIGIDIFAVSGAYVDTEISQVVKAVGRVITVTLPESIHDIDGYDPVSAETKDGLAEKTFVFPRRLTVSELRERLVRRLRDDYGIGYVDLELTADGTIEYLALGSRAAGIGPVLSPGTVAVAIQADPAFSASPGDTIQVWKRVDGEPTVVVTGELRAFIDDIVTISVHQGDADQLVEEGVYRLVTLPSELQVEKEFVSLLRAADETFARVEIGEGSSLTGVTIGALDVTIAAIRDANDRVTAVPIGSTQLAPGMTVYVIARPQDVRRFEVAAVPPDVA